LGVFEEVAQLKKEGKIRHLGFSFHDSAAVLDRILTEHPEMEYVQLQLNYFDWDSEIVQSGACYETAKRHRKPVIVMEPVKGGVLADVPQPSRRCSGRNSRTSPTPPGPSASRPASTM
jgi:predicted aldo/keto reductase-like oxidoreductase